MNIVWFRQDLRLRDNPALYEASQQEGKVLPIYILDDVNSGSQKMGAASRWWLHQALISLDDSLSNNLHIYSGNAEEIIRDLVNQFEVSSVYWNRCYEPWRIERDTKIKSFLKSRSIKAFSANASLLWEPKSIKKKDGTPYRVFTPFYRNGCLNAEPPRQPIARPNQLELIKRKNAFGLEQLNLLPQVSWHRKLQTHWVVSETAAHDRVDNFLSEGVRDYKEGRNFPAKENVSRLSPYLHFGLVSPNQVWYAAQEVFPDKNVDTFCSELGWREFSYSLLYFNSDLQSV